MADAGRPQCGPEAVDSRDGVDMTSLDTLHESGKWRVRNGWMLCFIIEP